MGRFRSRLLSQPPRKVLLIIFTMSSDGGVSPDRSPKPIDGPKRPTTTYSFLFIFWGNKFLALYCLWRIRTYITSEYIAIILKPHVQPIHNVHIISLGGYGEGAMVKVKGAESSQAGRDLAHSLSGVCPCVCVCV